MFPFNAEKKRFLKKESDLSDIDIEEYEEVKKRSRNSSLDKTSKSNQSGSPSPSRGPNKIRI